METKRIKIVVQEKTTKDGRKFDTYKTFSKNGRATEVKFRKDVKDLPKATCYIVCDVDDMNLNTSGEYPVLWIRAIQGIEDLNAANTESNRAKINDYFG